jgi:hypothetical protein
MIKMTQFEVKALSKINTFATMPRDKIAPTDRMGEISKWCGILQDLRGTGRWCARAGEI